MRKGTTGGESKLAALRAARGLGQRELARKIGRQYPTNPVFRVGGAGYEKRLPKERPRPCGRPRGTPPGAHIEHHPRPVKWAARGIFVGRILEIWDRFQSSIMERSSLKIEAWLKAGWSKRRSPDELGRHIQHDLPGNQNGVGAQGDERARSITSVISPILPKTNTRTISR